MCRKLGFFFEGGRDLQSWIFLTKRPIFKVKMEKNGFYHTFSSKLKLFFSEEIIKKFLFSMSLYVSNFLKMHLTQNPRFQLLHPY